jgi:hypothetical protein
MITKKSMVKIAVMSVIVAFTLSGCKKKEEEEPKVDESGQASTDSRQAIGENDVSIDDINKTISDYPLMHGRQAAVQTNTIAGLSVDTNGAYLGTIKLNYDGITVVNNRKRSGSIRLTILNYATGQRWKMAGCVMKVEYLAYRVTRASDAAFIELNGIQNLTNVSGGTWWELYTFAQPNLSSSVTGTNLSVNFNGAGTANYNIHRQFTYTLSPSYVLTCTGQGIGTSGGISNLENYGTTRDGDAFTSQVTSPIVWNTTCGGGAPISGHLIIKVASKSFDLDCLFGVNSSGQPITVGSNQCAYGWKLTWTVGTTTQDKVILYY